MLETCGLNPSLLWTVNYEAYPDTQLLLSIVTMFTIVLSKIHHYWASHALQVLICRVYAVDTEREDDRCHSLCCSLSGGMTQTPVIPPDVPYRVVKPTRMNDHDLPDPNTLMVEFSRFHLNSFNTDHMLGSGISLILFMSPLSLLSTSYFHLRFQDKLYIIERSTMNCAVASSWRKMTLVKL